jgi:hypothetical protein
MEQRKLQNAGILSLYFVTFRIKNGWAYMYKIFVKRMKNLWERGVWVVTCIWQDITKIDGTA